MIGLLALYWLGFPPSSIPPWAVARIVLGALAETTVLVTISAIACVVVVILSSVVCRFRVWIPDEEGAQ